MSVLDNAVEIIKSEGFTGPHSFIFLTRYAALTGDTALLNLIGNTLEDLDTMHESASLAYAYAEYCEARGEKAPEFCRVAADYILSSCDTDDRMLAVAYVKAARAFGREDYLARAVEILSDTEAAARGGAFSAIAFTEMYRATFNKAYLDAACRMAEVIEKNYHEMFSPEDTYDISQPSMNSAVAVMYDELARIVQTDSLAAARKRQNSFILKLAEKYPSRVSFGLCALFADEYEPKTVVCRFPGDVLPKPLVSLISFYSPVTEIIAEPMADVDIPVYYIKKHGLLEKI